MREKARTLDIDAEMLKRPLNVGFSGGEKKRNEILQMAVLEPRMCILDETDSGLDVDAMKLVAAGVNALRAKDRAFLVITHYQRLLDHITPDVVHIMADGRIVQTGGPSSRSRSRRTATPASCRVAVMAAPALKLDGAAALLAACPEPRGEASWARAARAAAARRLADRGAPVRRDEYWRFTDPTSLTVQPAAPAAAFAAEDAPIFEGSTPSGSSSSTGSTPPTLRRRLAPGIEIEPLSHALATDIDWARELFGVLEARGQDPVDRPLASYNTARATEGVAIRVTARAPKPVRLVYRHRSAEADVMLRHLVRLDAGADLTLLESGPAAARLNAVIEAEVADGAALHHVRAQGRDPSGAPSPPLRPPGRRARFKSFTLTFNGRLTRNEQLDRIHRRRRHRHVAGACVGDSDFLHDDTIFITHDAVGCESRQVFKKVLRGGAVGVFQGKILVKPGAQKTDGYQLSQGLLLDEAAQLLAKPELESTPTT